MRLVFSVLWFDDNEDYFDSLELESLEDAISSWGFWPQIEQVTTPEEFNDRSPFESYDLIVVDRNLEGYEDGQQFIANIRENAIYTEVIFYTAGNTSDLWEAIREKKLEGIFVSSRTNILSKIAKVGRQSIRKVLDLENMRGIVMAEVGELDHLLDEIITIGIKHLPQEQQKIVFTRFHKKVAQQYKKNDAILAEFIEAPTTNKMLELCDSNKRWQNFNRLKKYHNKLKNNESIGDYTQDVLRPRNSLAHGRPESHKDGGYVFHHHGKEFYFDDAVSLKLRQVILQYKEWFSVIIKELASDDSKG